MPTREGSIRRVQVERCKDGVGIALVRSEPYKPSTRRSTCSDQVESIDLIGSEARGTEGGSAFESDRWERKRKDWMSARCIERVVRILGESQPSRFTIGACLGEAVVLDWTFRRQETSARRDRRTSLGDNVFQSSRGIDGSREDSTWGWAWHVSTVDDGESQEDAAI